MNNTITMYGATWCADCKRSKTFLDEHAIAYEFIDIDVVDGAADRVAEINNGFKSIPTIIFPDNSVLVEPSNKVLEDKLKAISLM